MYTLFHITRIVASGEKITVMSTKIGVDLKFAVGNLFSVYKLSVRTKRVYESMLSCDLSHATEFIYEYKKDYR